MIKHLQNIVLHACLAVWVETGMFYYDFLSYLEDEIDLRASSQTLYKQKSIILPSLIIFESVECSYEERYIEPEAMPQVPEEVAEYCKGMIDYLFSSMAQTHELPSIYYELRTMVIEMFGEYDRITQSPGDVDIHKAMLDWVSRYEVLVESYGCVLPTK